MKHRVSKPSFLRVLARPAFSNRHLNPYNARIYQDISQHGIELVEYGLWGLTKRADVVHVHWPESTFNHNLWGGLVDDGEFAVMSSLGKSARRENPLDHSQFTSTRTSIPLGKRRDLEIVIWIYSMP